MTTAARYRLLAKWASGGMADIYVARQQGLAGFDKLVALKFLRDVGDTEGLREMFLEEVRTAALLNHPNIIQTFDADQLGDRLFLAMEFIHGETLGRFTRAVLEASGSFPVELAVSIARDLANALDYAHSLTNLEGTRLQLVHRDVSPSNVLLSFDGMVKLLDFGIAKVATQLSATGAGVIKGKFSYMAPEQARGHEVDHRADIYALGIVLWQLLAGKAAFDARSDAELLRQVIDPLLPPPSVAGAKCNAALDEIVMTALAPRIEDRYETAGELATALSRYLTRHAAGFDGPKLIRGLMTVHFSHTRDRLAAVVKRTEPEFALDDIDDLVHQPSLRTPTPIAAPSAAPPARLPTLTAIEPSGPVSTISAAPPRTTHRRTLGWVVLAAAVATGGGLAVHASLDEPPATPAAIPVPPAVAEPPRTVAIAEPAAEPIAAPPDAGAEPARRPIARPPAPPRLAPRAPVRVRPSPAPAIATTTDRARVDAGSARPEARAGSSGGSARLAQGSGLERPIAEPAPAPAPRTPVAPSAPSAPTLPVTPIAPPELGSLDAVPVVARVAVNGSLTTSEVQAALERTTGRLRECYRLAASKARATPALAIRIAFVIDEARAPRGVTVTGDSLGLADCTRDTIANIRTRSAPDVGTVSVIAQIRFRPTRKGAP